MNYLMTQIIEAETTREVDSIVTKNIFEIPGCQRAKLTIFARKRKEHIIRLQLQKKVSYGIEMN